MDARRRHIELLIGLVAVVAVDLGTKLLAEEFAAGQKSGLIVPARNPEFSLGTANASFFVTILVAAAGIAIAGWFTIPLARRGELAVWVPVLLLGGATANLVDRLCFGSVHDFIALPWIVLNLADIFVVAGLIGLARHYLARQGPRAPEDSR